MPLHLSRVAYGCDSLAMLEARLGTRGDGAQARLTTRYRPKRAEEIAGGSLYWIIAHKIVARSPSIWFADADGGRTDIVIAARAIPVLARPRRSHQGWRYLEDADKPVDLADGAEGADTLPGSMRDELATLGLV
jgi:hypothetical protein